MEKSIHQIFCSQTMQKTAWLFFLLSLLCATWCTVKAYHLTRPGEQFTTLDPLRLEKSDSDALSSQWDCHVFQKKTPTELVNTGELNRYRLAGTFLVSQGNRQTRKAIIDDLKAEGPEKQKMVGEGSILDSDGVRVTTIQADYVILTVGQSIEKIALSFTTASSEREQTTTAEAGEKSAALNLGVRVEDSRWILKRDALLDYYEELMHDTERLASVFDSLKPLYQDGKINGYVLDMEGEKEMFHTLGLRQNDIVRKLNSMPMTSQRRAEYFISEFVKNRVNGFILDIERDGKPQKLVYLVR